MKEEQKLKNNLHWWPKKINVDYERDSDTNPSWSTWNNLQEPWKETQWTGTQRKKRNHHDYSRTKIGEDILKNSEELRKLQFLRLQGKTNK